MTSETPSESLDTRPPYRWACATFAAVLVVYLVTLAPTTAFWDTAEYIAAAKVLGIPHPPGNPLFTLMAHVWGLLPLATDYAVRINLFAAVTSAAGAGFWFLVSERWLRDILPARGPRLAASFAGVFASAMAWTVWSQSTVNEKVYTVSLLTIALVVWCMIRWADAPVGERRDRWVVLAVYLSFLSSTNHQMGLLGLPVVGWYILMTDWRIILRWRVVSLTLFVAVLGVTLHHIYLPMRAGQFPPINEGEPVGFGSDALKEVLSRHQYGKPPVTDRMSPFGAQLANYWTYWSWQWARDYDGLRQLATTLFTVLGLAGLVALLRRNLRSGGAAGGLLVTLTLLLIFYLNFRYGYSYHLDDPGITPAMREVRERDYFYIVSFAFVGVLFAAGFALILREAGDRLGHQLAPARRHWLAAPVLLLSLVPLVGNRLTAPRSGETLAHDFAVDLLQSVEPYGILVTKGDNDTFPLWFAQEVLGIRRDVTLINLSLANTPWHLRQVQRRPIEPFDVSTALPVWRRGADSATMPLTGASVVGEWPMPQGPLFLRTEAWLNSLPGRAATPAGTPSAGGLTLQFGNPSLTRADIAMSAVILDNIGRRPIYFSWSAGSYPDQTFGLSPWLVSQGMVRRLMPDSVVIGGNIVDGPLGPTDLARTRSLLFEAYHHESAARDRPRGWADPPSGIILQMYLIAYGYHAPLLAEHGDTVLAARADAIAQRVRRSMPGEVPR